MQALLTAIMTKTVGSALETAVAGRIYLDAAPEGAEFPYVVFSIVTSVPDDTFTEEIEDTLIQFSIYSISASAVEIAGIYANLKALFKNASLTISGDTHIWLEQRVLITMTDDRTTPAGTEIIRHWAVDYSILVQG